MKTNNLKTRVYIFSHEVILTIKNVTLMLKHKLELPRPIINVSPNTIDGLHQSTATLWPCLIHGTGHFTVFLVALTAHYW